MYPPHNAQYAPPPGAPLNMYGQPSNLPPSINGYAAPPQQYIPPHAVPDMYAGPSTAPQQFQSYGYNPRPIPHSPSVQSIPEPTRKAEYQAPAFKTFQERKREREAALRAAAGVSEPHSSPAPPPVTTTPPPMITRSPSGPSTSRPAPPVAALAMMGTPGGQAPTPPPRVRPLPNAQPQPQPQQQPPSQGWGGAPAPPLRVPSPMSSAPSPAPRVNSPLVSAPPRPPPIIVPPPGTQVPSSAASPSSPAPPIPGNKPQPTAPRALSGPRPAAVAALVERSDTVSSVKSVDRVGFGPTRRALPRPPVGVAPSKSLDRGNLPAVNSRRVQRRVPSPVGEEDTAGLAARLAGVSVGGIVPGSPRSPPTTVSSPRSPVTPLDDSPSLTGQAMPALPRICFDEPPKSPTVPVITIDDQSRPRSPAAPTITVIEQPRPRSPAAPLTSILDRPRPKAPKVPTIAITPELQPKPVPSIQTPSIPTISVDSEPDKPRAPPVPIISIGGPPEPPSISISPPAVTINPPPPTPSFAISGPPTIEVSSFDTRTAGPLPIAVSPTAAASSVGPTRIHANSAILCAGCTNPIIGRIVSAMNQRWHPQCFMCQVCHEPLEHVSAYEHDGKPYCHLDYHERFAHKCHHCQTPIVDPSFVTLEDETLGQRYYHELHFFCSECGDPFLDPSKSSAPGGLAQGEETNPFVIHKGHPYCERCHLRLHKPKCRKCVLPIPDVAVSAMGSKWHAGCFVCDNCGGPFGNNLFFPKDGKAYCTECFGDMEA